MALATHNSKTVVKSFLFIEMLLVLFSWQNCAVFQVAQTDSFFSYTVQSQIFLNSIRTWFC